jgi:biopolymer transport protein ExbD
MELNEPRNKNIKPPPFMSEINTNPSAGFVSHKGVRRSKKMSTRVDMTPMVDLGFLLITFFIFTTTLNKNVVLKVDKPPSGQETHPERASQTLTVMMGKNNKVYWYMGANDPNKNKTPEINITDYSVTGLSHLLAIKDKEVRKATGFTDPKMLHYDSNGVVVIIKPLDESNFKNIVDVLDEMKIANIVKYSWADANASDLALLEKNGMGR